MVQWLKCHAPNAGGLTGSLVRELNTHAAAKGSTAAMKDPTRGNEGGNKDQRSRMLEIRPGKNK